MLTLIDIDEVVIKASRLHLKGICGDSLNQYEGDNYKVSVREHCTFLHRKKVQIYLYILVVLCSLVIPCLINNKKAKVDPRS